MAASLTTELVWGELEDNLFGVLGYVTPRQEARTVGIVYVVRDFSLYITTRRSSWKAKHIPLNPNVSMTVPIPKRIPLLPWIKIPAATITFFGTAAILALDEVSQEFSHTLFRGLEEDPDVAEDLCIIKVTPEGDFLTYGVGVPLLAMRDRQQARGRVPVHYEVG